MKVVDPISFWSEPSAIVEWGQKCKPPIAPAWQDYINFQLHPDDLIILCRVIFPAFVIVGDYTLLGLNAEGHSEHNLLDFSRQAQSASEFEKDFNTLKVYDLFSHARVIHEESFEAAAQLLKKSWEMALSLTFPERTYSVVLSNTDRDYGPTISFSRCRNADHSAAASPPSLGAT